MNKTAFSTALLFACVIFCIPCARATPILSVDLGRDGQAVESGFTGFSTPGNHGSSFDSTVQAFSGGTWQLTATGQNTFTRNYADIPTSPLGDLLEDSFLTNHENGGTIDLFLNGLAPGDYQLTTYHHSFGGQWGAAAAISGTLTGDALSPLGTVTGTTGSDLSSFASFTVGFTTTGLQNGYHLQFDPNVVGSQHFDFSGFQLSTAAVPETGSSALCLTLALSGLVGYRRLARR